MSSSTIAPVPGALADAWPSPRRSVRNACIASSLAIACWVALAAWTNHSQLQDSLEQFVWGQSLQWGYWKHPPLTSWLMWAGLQVFGPVPWVTYVLGGLLTVLTILFTTRLAHLLAGERVAVLTALLLALHYGFTRRAQMFNHNTVLVACMAMAAVATFHAMRRNRRRDWVLVGLASGLALLAKYQAAVPLAGLVLVVVLVGEGRRCLRGIVLASLCAAVVVLPHGLWALQHDLQTVTYAMASLEAGATHQPHPLRLLPVLAMQAKYFLTIGAFAAVLWAATRWRGGTPVAQPAPMTALQRRWFAGLVLVPMAVLLGAASARVQVQSHWGFQASQFLVVPIAILLHRRFG
ncbi:MAG TPA: glycosyltransferase family 39 protein, partial [Ramlibacter sp.]